MLFSQNVPGIRPPDRRVLRAFAFDPMTSRLSGQFLSINIPFEHDLEPGPNGDLVQVVDYDATRDCWYQPIDLDDPPVLAQQGLRPSESDPRSHQQIVYAVSMSVIERFQRFTGRRFRWRGDERLRLVPHAFYGRNAYFDPKRRAVFFGYYRADETDTEANLPRQLMFTCLSIDIIAHEVTHAIVHRVRPLFTIATNRDVFAYHEAFADLVAMFHHFLFRDIVETAVAGARSELGDATALLSLAHEFGKSTGRGGPLRSFVGSEPDPELFRRTKEPHQRGAKLHDAPDATRSAARVRPRPGREWPARRASRHGAGAGSGTGPRRRAARAGCPAACGSRVGRPSGSARRRARSRACGPGR